MRSLERRLERIERCVPVRDLARTAEVDAVIEQLLGLPLSELTDDELLRFTAIVEELQDGTVDLDVAGLRRHVFFGPAR